MLKKIIFDTDLGGDCDDVMALDVLCSAHKAGESELIGCTFSAWAKNAPACIYAILRQHGLEQIPIGCRDIACLNNREDCYASAVARAFPSELLEHPERAENAVTLLRKLLAENEAVTLVITGFLTNIAALLNSEPDEISPLDGCELVREKVAEMCIMAGNFSHLNGLNPTKEQIGADGSLKAIPEWNIIWDIPAAQKVFDDAPCPITVLPYEVGFKMLTGKPMREHGDAKTPDSMCYTVHGSLNGRDSWDPCTALYGVYGAGKWFYRTAAGKIIIDSEGCSDFVCTKDGSHRILECALPQEEIAKDIDAQVMRLFQ